MDCQEPFCLVPDEFPCVLNGNPLTLPTDRFPSFLFIAFLVSKPRKFVKNLMP